ncbi:HTR7 [Branchiostoma lanceolatum]|uniref:HTR7 protein n=1 Tax=Branchiostoma lanceolatum TaxID=7740 RepID=A0A8J9YS25_BRALA|nr:HTR7 [Branchiostoma lanceolatum]
MADDYEHDNIANGSLSLWMPPNTSVYDATPTSALVNSMDGLNMGLAATVGRSVVLAVVLLLSLVGNMLVCYVFVRKPVILADVGHRFVLNLACCDIGITLLVIPFSLTSSIYNQWVFGTEWCQGQGFIGNLLFCASILTLAVVSVDRFSAILRPLQYNSTFTSRWSVGVIAAVWVVSACVALPPLVGWGRYGYQGAKFHCTLSWLEDENISYAPFLIVVAGAVPIVVMLFSYGWIGQTAFSHRRRLNRIQPHSCKVTGGPAYRRQDCKAARTIFCITAGFVVCWVPYLVVTGVELGGMEVPAEVETTAVWLRFIACVINPFIYGYMNRMIRKTVWRLFKRKAVDQGTTTTVVGTDDLWNSATAAPAQLAATNTQTSRLSAVNLIEERAKTDRTVGEEAGVSGFRRTDTVVRFADEAETIVSAPIEESSLDREVSDDVTLRQEDLPGVPQPTPSEE